MNTQQSETREDESERRLALKGIRVLDLGILVQGPQAALLMADLGADVIKVELPEVGDQARWLPASLDDPRPPWFIGCNRGKRSITLDLRVEKGREIFVRLAETADIVISNFLPGTLEGWGIGYDDLSQRNPGIIYGAASAFGPLGPNASRKGADLTGQASGGMMMTTGTGPDDITPIGVTLSDHIGSQNLVNGILAALFFREKTGRGQKVDVSLLGGQIYAQASEYTYYFLTGDVPGHANHGHPMVKKIYGVFPTLDGHIAIAGVAEGLVQPFFEAVGMPELAEDRRYNVLLITEEDRKTLFRLLAEKFQTKSTAEWESILFAAGQRYAPVRDYAQVTDDEGAFINGYLQRVDHPEWGPISMVGCPIRLSETPANPGGFAPELGQHTEEVLLELGYGWDEITSFRDAGTI